MVVSFLYIHRYLTSCKQITTIKTRKKPHESIMRKCYGKTKGRSDQNLKDPTTMQGFNKTNGESSPNY